MRSHFVVLLLLALSACDHADEPYRVVGELASDRIEISAETAEPIIEIAVKEGEAISAGQLLVRQDPRRAEAQLAETEAALAQAQARLEELVRGPRSERIAAARANVRGAKQDVDFRIAEHTRIERIFERKLTSPDALDRAKAELDAANALLELRQAELEEMLSGTTVEELAQAEQTVEQARSRRDYALIALERTELYAPLDGILDTRLYEVGERPQAGQAVVILLPASQPYARVYVPENIRVHITAGTRAEIHVDGLDGSIDGTVRWVSSEAAFTPYYALTERDRGRLSYLAKVELNGSTDRLPEGVPVDVRFLTVDRH